MQTTPWNEFALEKQLSRVKEENQRLKQTVFDLSRGRIHAQATKNTGGSVGGREALFYPAPLSSGVPSSSSASVPSSVKSAPVSVAGGPYRARRGSSSNNSANPPNSSPTNYRLGANRNAMVSRSNTMTANQANRGGNPLRPSRVTNKPTATIGTATSQPQPQQPVTSRTSLGVTNNSSIDERKRRREQLTTLYGGGRTQSRPGTSSSSPQKRGSSVANQPQATRSQYSTTVNNDFNENNNNNNTNNETKGKSLLSGSIFSGVDTGELSQQLRNEMFSNVGGHNNNNNNNNKNPANWIMLDKMTTANTQNNPINKSNDPQNGHYYAGGGQSHEPTASTFSSPFPYAYKDPKKEILRQLAENGERLAAILTAADPSVVEETESVNNDYRFVEQGAIGRTSEIYSQYEKKGNVGAAVAEFDSREPYWEGVEKDGKRVDSPNRWAWEQEKLRRQRQRESASDGAVTTNGGRPEAVDVFTRLTYQSTGNLKPSKKLQIEAGVGGQEGGGPITYTPRTGVARAYDVGAAIATPREMTGTLSEISNRRLDPSDAFVEELLIAYGHPSHRSQPNNADGPVLRMATINVGEGAMLSSSSKAQSEPLIQSHSLIPTANPPRALNPATLAEAEGHYNNTNLTATNHHVEKATVYQKLPYYAKHDPFYKPPPPQRSTTHRRETSMQKGSYDPIAGAPSNQLNSNHATSPPIAQISSSAYQPASHAYGEMVGPHGRGLGMTPQQYLDQLRVASHAESLRTLSNAPPSHVSHVEYQSIDHMPKEPFARGGNNNNNNILFGAGEALDRHVIAYAAESTPLAPLPPPSGTQNGDNSALYYLHHQHPPLLDSIDSLRGVKAEVILQGGSSVQNDPDTLKLSSRPPLYNSSYLSPSAVVSPTHHVLIYGGVTTHSPLQSVGTTPTRWETVGVAARPPSNSAVYTALMGRRSGGGSIGLRGRVGDNNNNKGEPLGANAPSPTWGDNNRPNTANSTISMASLDGTGQVRDLLSWANNL